MPAPPPPPVCGFKISQAGSENDVLETSFDSKQPKQTEDKLKQFDREHILVFFQKVRVDFGLFLFVSKQFVFVVYI
jgi:hypothetical protein